MVAGRSRFEALPNAGSAVRRAREGHNHVLQGAVTVGWRIWERGGRTWGQLGGLSARAAGMASVGGTGAAGGAGNEAEVRRVAAGEWNETEFCGNSIYTTKYNILTAVPKNIAEQFRRLANVYFLFISALQQIPGISPTGRYVTLQTLSLVMGLTMIKEFYEDYKRYRTDKRINNDMRATVIGSGRGPGAEGAESSKKVPAGAAAQASAGNVELAWKDIRVGMLLRLKNKEQVPADCLLLSTSEVGGCAYVETSQLDGETNLKLKQSLDETQAIVHHREGLRAVVECDLPNPQLYVFNGVITIDNPTFGSQAYPLDARQVLLRGSVLRDTEWALCLVIYTGVDTKLMMNNRGSTHKQSQLEGKANQQILFMFLFQICLCGVAAYLFAHVRSAGQGRQLEHWYLPVDDSTHPVLTFVTFLILINNLIPISLYVSIEVVKLLQANFIEADCTMYDSEFDQAAVSNTSNLCEELGQVQCVLADKTGTLTRNVMTFKKCTINGDSYGMIVPDSLRGPDSTGTEFYDPRLEADLEEDLGEYGDNLRDFFWHLSVCHTVIPEALDDGRIEYQASSPDEKALVEGAKQLGFEFLERNPDAVRVKGPDGASRIFEVLAVNEFSSARKRMSVVVRTADGQLRLLCKGADNVMMPLLDSVGYESSVMKHKTLANLTVFASEGLRTLCIADKVLAEEDFSAWYNKWYHPATIALDHRDELLEEAAIEIEQDLRLLGATAIEDKLQQGVPETIATLAAAGVRTWVLTGDKQETAINIGYACELLTPTMYTIVLNEVDPDLLMDALTEELQALYTQLEQHGLEHSGSVMYVEDAALCKSESRLSRMREALQTSVEVLGISIGLVIDGATLHTVMAHDDLLDTYTLLVSSCQAIICCRVSPLQKAEMVKLVREQLGFITLAIGDGANDVPMLLQAHVGIGIAGREGMQAVRNSDYAISQFRFLRRLLLVHGRLAYMRSSKVLLYSFYKNTVMSLSLYWFSFSNRMTGTALYESYLITMFNVFFTFLPILVYGVTERDMSLRQMERTPQLYASGRRGELFNARTFWRWVLDGVMHSAVCFFVPTLVLRAVDPTPDGESGGMFSSGLVVYCSVVLVTNLRLALDSIHWNILVHVSMWGTLGLWFVVTLVYGLPFFSSAFPDTTPVLGLAAWAYRAVGFWVAVAISVACCLLVDFVLDGVQRDMWPSDAQVVQEVEILRRSAKAALLAGEEGRYGTSLGPDGISPVGRPRVPCLNPTTSSTYSASPMTSRRSTVHHTGFAFSEDEHNTSKVALRRESMLLSPPTRGHGSVGSQYSAGRSSLTQSPAPASPASPRLSPSERVLSRHRLSNVSSLSLDRGGQP